MKRNYKTLILNSDYKPLCIKTWQDAIVLIMKNKAYQVDFYKNDSIKDGRGRNYSIPSVIALHKYIRKDYKKAPFSKSYVFARDKFTCQYCTNEFKSQYLTLDHVVPRSKWKGYSSPTCWTNIVTACEACNRKKADKTCNESGMYPMHQPVQPGYDEIFFGIHFHGKVEREWIKWLSVFDSFKNLEIPIML